MDTSHTDRPEITAHYTPLERPTIQALTAFISRYHAQGGALTLKLNTPKPNSTEPPSLKSFTLSYVDLTTTPPRSIYYTSIDGATVYYSGSLYHAETEPRPACLEPAELISLTDETGRTSRTITEAAR
jgi:hypothetical protein